MLLRYIIFILTVYCCFLLITETNSTKTSNDDINIIRQRILEIMIWPLKDNISMTIHNALLFTETLNSSCYWPDINYEDKSIVVWLTIQHMYRITTMLQALTMKDSIIQNNTRMRTAVHCALNVWLINDWQNPNWSFNEMDIPIQATEQLLMLGDNATNFEIEKIKEISFRAAWWLNRSSDVGANVVWMIQAQLYRSLATNNRTGIEQGFQRIWQDINISSADEGIQSDWSYHFHRRQLLSGSYGEYWAENILSFILCSNQTQYEPNQQQLLIFAHFLTKGDAWMIIGDTWDWHVNGRQIAKPIDKFHVSFDVNSIYMFAELIESNDTRIELINFANRLESQINASLLNGNTHFFSSDYQVHRRTNWTSTIKMQSSRTRPNECINGENQKAEHTGQGVLNLYTTNADDYHFIFPLLDWQAINGITVEHDIPLEICQKGSFPFEQLSFVGGVSDNQYGLAMMDTVSHNLTAKRSWHFYDDAIIALATNLSLTTPTTAWTTLASRLLNTGQITIGFFNSTIHTLADGNYSFPYFENKTSNVQWIHVGETNIAYLLQIQKQYTSVGIEIGTRTGNFHTIGPYNYTVTARLLTIWLNHGQGPYTLDYNYIILPNISLESVPIIIKQYEEEQIFSCISTNNLFHGTMWPSLKRASFILWDNITTTFSCQSSLFEVNIQLNEAGAYLFSETDSDFTVTASHPMRINGSIEVIVDRVGYGQGCSTILSNMNESQTNVTLTLPSSPELSGASVKITCKKTKYK